MEFEEVARDQHELRSPFNGELPNVVECAAQVCRMRFCDLCTPRGERPTEIEISGMEYPAHAGEHLLLLALWRNSAMWSHSFRWMATVAPDQSCRTIAF